MSFIRLWAILRKEFRHIRRDKRTLFLVTLSPAIMLLSFSYLFASEIQTARLGVWDLDHSALSRRLVASVTADGKFQVTGTPDSYARVREAMERGDISLALVIPPDFESKVLAGETSPLQLVADGSVAASTSAAVVRFRQRVAEFQAKLDTVSSLPGPVIQVQAQAWYNRELDSMFSMVPGLIPIVMILPSLAIALAVTREKELGSFETLITTPIRSIEYLIGKLIPYLTFGVVSALVAFLVAILWFKVPLRGSVLDLLVLTLCYLVASLGESLFIAGLLSSQGTVMRIILILVFIPSFFLSGTILPIDSTSGPGRIVSFILPSTYFVQITRGVFLKGEGVLQLQSPATSLLLLGLVPIVASLVAFRKQVD